MPSDQAHIESCFERLKHDWAHLCHPTDPADLSAELGHAQQHYNHVRPHAGIGHVTPDDEHHGRGPQIRRARRAGQRRARAARIAHHRQPRLTA